MHFTIAQVEHGKIPVQTSSERKRDLTIFQRQQKNRVRNVVKEKKNVGFTMLVATATAD